MKKCGLFIILLGMLFTAFGAVAQQTHQAKPFQASLTPDIAIYDQDVMIRGLTLSLWGENPQEALSLGLVNGSVGDSSGFSIAYLLNYSENYKGVNWGFVNYTKGDFLGWQSGTINYTANNFTGLQTGAVNYADQLKGLQLGLFNFTEEARDTAIQVGLINVIRENRKWFSEFPDAVAPAMVFVNWRF